MKTYTTDMRDSDDEEYNSVPNCQLLSTCLLSTEIYHNSNIRRHAVVDTNLLSGSPSVLLYHGFQQTNKASARKREERDDESEEEQIIRSSKRNHQKG